MMDAGPRWVLGYMAIVGLCGCADQRKSADGAAAARENEPQWPWVVYGRVTDEQGQGLAGVEVGTSCGWATLTGSGRTTTDARGDYRMRIYVSKFCPLGKTYWPPVAA